MPYFVVMQTSVAIEVENLSVSFDLDSPKRVFENLSFSVYAGEHIALTGASGVGKSTLLRCLLGLVEPNAGEIVIDGEVLNAKSVWNLRGQMAFVPQEADLGVGATREFIERPFKYRINFEKAKNLENLSNYMQALGLDLKLLDSKVGSLSGGEKQRMALVSALLLDRPILLLDEVASALDSDSAKLVFNLLAGLKEKTIIGVVHDGAKMPFATREIGIGEKI